MLRAADDFATGHDDGDLRDLARPTVMAVAKKHGVKVAALLGRDRSRYLAVARRELYAELHRAGLSYPEIGRVCHRDHSTVLAALRSRSKRLPWRSMTTAQHVAALLPWMEAR